MRHRVLTNNLSRTTAERKRLFRQMVTSLILNDQISTTLAKAKSVRKWTDRVITWWKNGNEKSVRGFLLKQELTVPQLHHVLLPRYLARAGGYTRIHRIDNDRGIVRAILEYVDGPNDLQREKVAGMVGREMVFGKDGSGKNMMGFAAGGRPRPDSLPQSRTLAEVQAMRQRWKTREQEITYLMEQVQNGSIGASRAEGIVDGLIEGKSFGPGANSHGQSGGMLSARAQNELWKAFRYIPKVLPDTINQFPSPPPAAPGEKEIEQDRSQIHRLRIPRKLENPTLQDGTPLATPFTRAELAQAFLLRCLNHSRRLIGLAMEQDMYSLDQQADLARNPAYKTVNDFRQPTRGRALEPGQIRLPLVASRNGGNGSRSQP